MARTADRGYGSSHQKARLRALRTYSPTDLCWRCGEPLGSDPSKLDYGHTDDRSGYGGLEHANNCNRSAGGKTSAAKRALRKRPPEKHPGLI